ncbi:MAG TPA: hypothetical protein VFK85_05880 [Anaeromyxobacteraceae bacterium]|nr:hypothetical protein [Anaeromyxobacteraceae bacterium]
MKDNDSSLEFGRVLDGKTSDRKVWFLIIPVVVGLGALLVFAGLAMSKSGGLESKVKLAEQQAEEARKAVDERDALLKKARADEGVLRSAGQGAAVMAAAQPDSPASGVALVHPEHKAVKLFVFGLEHPQPGQEYRAIALGPDKQQTKLGSIVPDDRGTAFLLAKNLPEGATGVEVVLAKVEEGNAANADAKQGDAAGASGDAQGSQADSDSSTLVLAGVFPKPGTAGVVAPPDPQQLQARNPRSQTRRPLRR